MGHKDATTCSTFSNVARGPLPRITVLSGPYWIILNLKSPSVVNVLSVFPHRHFMRSSGDRSAANYNSVF